MPRTAAAGGVDREAAAQPKRAVGHEPTLAPLAEAQFLQRLDHANREVVVDLHHVDVVTRGLAICRPSAVPATPVSSQSAMLNGV